MSNIIKEKIKKGADGYGTLAPAFIEGAKFILENQWKVLMRICHISIRN